MLNSLKIYLKDTFTDELKAVRLDGFGERYGPNIADKADSYSFHITICDEQSTIATVRITPGSRYSILNEWFEGKYPFTPTKNFAEITRGAVIKQYQGYGLYKLMMTEAIFCCYEMQFDYIFCAARIDLPQLPFLKKLGFVEIGNGLTIKTPSKNVVLQPIYIEIKNEIKNVREINQKIVQELEKKSIKVEISTRTQAHPF